jgi:hypothetical protein
LETERRDLPFLFQPAAGFSRRWTADNSNDEPQGDPDVLLVPGIFVERVEECTGACGTTELAFLAWLAISWSGITGMAKEPPVVPPPSLTTSYA